MPLLLTLAIIVVVLVVLVLLYLTFVPIVASVQAAACLTIAELAWGIVVMRARLDLVQRTQRLELRIAGLTVWQHAPEEGGGEGRRCPQGGGPFPCGPGADRPSGDRSHAPRPTGDPAASVAVLRETRIRLRLGLVFGTGDAATTGEIFGALMALRGAVSAQPWLTLEATPVFDGPVFDWNAEGEARLRSPIRMILPSLRLFLRVRAIVQQEAARS